MGMLCENRGIPPIDGGPGRGPGGPPEGGPAGPPSWAPCSGGPPAKLTGGPPVCDDIGPPMLGLLSSGPLPGPGEAPGGRLIGGNIDGGPLGGGPDMSGACIGAPVACCLIGAPGMGWATGGCWPIKPPWPGMTVVGGRTDAGGIPTPLTLVRAEPGVGAGSDVCEAGAVVGAAYFEHRARSSSCRHTHKKWKM